jgi:hypothetical protein
VTFSASIDVTIGNKKLSIDRAKLRQWLLLEDIREKIQLAAEVRDRQEVVTQIYSYLSAAFGIDIDLDKCAWFEVIEVFTQVISLNVPRFDFPLLTSKLDNQKVAWDYEGRTWYIWVHLLARYGWSMEYIANIDIDDALALAQEVAVEDQLEKEWAWGLSDKSTVYDKKGKNAKFKELPRPGWMTKVIDRVEEGMMFPANMLPVGLIYTWDRDKDETSKPS